MQAALLRQTQLSRARLLFPAAPWAALKLLLTTTAMAAAAHCSYGLLAGSVGARGAAVAAILLAAAVYIVLLLSLEVVSREEIEQLPKGGKLAKFLFRA